MDKLPKNKEAFCMRDGQLTFPLFGPFVLLFHFSRVFDLSRGSWRILSFMPP
jgi:hypothetical protein